LRSLAALVLLGCLAPVQAQVSVTTFHNDNARTGQNTQETILTPSNVNFNQFGKLFSVPVTGTLYAQPLYLWGQNIGGGTHNVLYVATEHDNVYAMDADTGAVYAQVSLIPSGGSTVSSSADLGCGDNVPEIGITGTPVIDTASGTLYVVAKSKVNGNIVQYLHALDVSTLAEKFGGPVQIQATVPGTAPDSSGGVLTFSAKWENQRAALLLTSGHVVIAWASHCDFTPWHGWLMSYNAATLAQEAVLSTAPNGYGNGIWMSGGGPAADATGNIYIPTGNGPWDTKGDWGDSILKLGPPASGTFPVLDYFTPYNQATLNSNDTDLASGGLTLLPPLGNTQQLVQQGKAGTIVLLNTGNLGKYCLNLTPACSGTDPQIVQEIQNASSGIWGSPAYWNGNLYWTGTNDSIHAYSFNQSANPPIAPTSQSAQAFAFSAPTPTVSSSGTTNGILWALDGSADDSTCDGGGSACLGLYAYDATNLAHLLYISSQAANNRDSPGTAVKFEKPIVANGKVYVGTQSSVTVYGLLPSPSSYTEVSLGGSAHVDAIVATGSAVPGGGLDGQGSAYSAALLGTSLVWNGNTYAIGAAGVPDAVSNTTIALPAGNYSTLSLLATAVNGNQTNQTFTVNYSDGTSSTFVQSLSDWFTPQKYTGESPALAMPYRLTSSGAQDNRTFYLYGYNFTLNSAKTAVSVTLPANRNVVVLAVDVTGSAGATPPAAAPTFTPAPGTYTSTQSVQLASTTVGASIYYTTNGTTPTTGSTLYNNATPIAVSSSTTIAAITAASGYSNSTVASGAYVINPSTGTGTAVSLGNSVDAYGVVATGSTVPGGGLDGQGDAYSAALLGTSLVWNGNTYAIGAAGAPDAVSNTTITLPAGNYGTLSLLATAVNGNQTSQTFTVHYSDGTSSNFVQSLSDWFTPQSYSGESQALKMAYRVQSNGALDNRTFYLYAYNFALNSAKTAVSITLPANRKVVVLAADVTGSGSVAPPAAAPTFTPVPGTYTSTQSVQLASTTAGASIYYTTNGTTPTTGSTLYNSATPIAVNSSATIAAIAAASGYSNSTVASGAYVINLSTGTGTAVSLGSSVDVYGIVATGSTVPGGGLDGQGFAYSAALLRSSLVWNGNTYAIGAAGVPDAVSNTTIALPAGNYSTLSLLATAVNGNQTSQAFTVNYSDGTSSTFVQSLSDWFTPQKYTGESQALAMPYRLTSSGAQDNRTFYLYGYNFTLNSAKTAVSITLPANRKVVVIAIDVE
jgi:hypothetical protein